MTITVIHIHKTEGAELNPITLFEVVNRKLDFIIKQLTEMANKQERFNAILASLNEVTNQIAADYQKLLTEVRDGSVSDESLATAEANIAKLQEIAASDDQPVPGETIPPADGGGL